MKTFYQLRFEIPLTWRARSPYLYPLGRRWSSYTPRHWIPFSSPPTARRATVEVFEPASTRGSLTPKSKSHLLTVSQSVNLGVEPQFITLWHLRSCVSGAPCLTRGRVCLLYMLLALASVVFLGSESLGTRDHILLSQIWDFPFRRLLLQWNELLVLVI
jgi:hypothetical protein